eukprot:g2269.t1
MLGSYTALSGGNCCSAFRAFTGEASYVWARSEGEMARVEGEWKKMQLAEGEDFFVWQPGSEDRRDAESLWDEVRSADAQSFLEHVREDGLVEAHAYSLLQAVDVEGQRLVFLRNPWGNDKRWNGRWCDGDEAWDRFPSLRKRLRPRFRSDGAFWMAWVDFQASFDFVFVCPKTMRSTAAATEHRRRSEMGEVPQPATPAPAARRRRRIAQALPERLPRLPPGARVELMGEGDLDGALFEVIGFDEAASMYQLRSVPPSYWTCPKCGEVNKQSRSACNVCGGARDALVPGSSSSHYRVRPEFVILPAGTEALGVPGLENRYHPTLRSPGLYFSVVFRFSEVHRDLPSGQLMEHLDTVEREQLRLPKAFAEDFNRRFGEVTKRILQASLLHYACSFVVALAFVLTGHNRGPMMTIDTRFVVGFLSIDFLLNCLVYVVTSERFGAQRLLLHAAYGTFNTKTYFFVVLGSLFGYRFDLRVVILTGLLTLAVKSYGLHKTILKGCGWPCFPVCFYVEHRIGHLPVVYQHAHKMHHYLHDTTAFDAHIYGSGMNEEFFWIWAEDNFHADHHTLHRANYGSALGVLLDFYFGTQGSQTKGAGGLAYQRSEEGDQIVLQVQRAQGPLSVPQNQPPKMEEDLHVIRDAKLVVTEDISPRDVVTGLMPRKDIH